MPEPYSVEIQLARGTNTTPGTFDLTLVDRDRSGIRSPAVVSLDLQNACLPLRDGSSIAAAEFCRRFLCGESAGAEQGLAFGRLLHERLFSGSAVASLWRDVQSLRCDRPLRVELILPDPPDADLADLPFELLADNDGFLFLRFGHTLVRTIEGLRGERLVLGRGARALCAWANPLVQNAHGDRGGGRYRQRGRGTRAPRAGELGAVRHPLPSGEARLRVLPSAGEASSDGRTTASAGAGANGRDVPGGDGAAPRDRARGRQLRREVDRLGRGEWIRRMTSRSSCST